MASFMYNAGAALILSKAVAGAALDLRARLVCTNTTVDTENDGKDHLDDFTTMDTHDGSGYADIACTSETVTTDDTNGRGVLDVADITWSSLGAGTRSIEGVLIYHQDSAADSGRIPVVFIDTTNIASNGGDVTLTINASGLLAITGTGAP